MDISEEGQRILGPLSIEQLAQLRDEASAILAEKVTGRQAELEAEMARVSALTGGRKIQDKPKVAVKFRHPTDPNLSWVGRGSKPR